jgi:hypothetical protein
MKEDILEQLVDDYLRFKGFFTMHNVKFQPHSSHQEYVKAEDCVPSDIDVIGYHPWLNGADKVWVVSCKSWQSGFDADDRIRAIEQGKTREGRNAWKSFRELTKSKWAEGLIEKVNRLTGVSEFTYVTAVTKLIGNASAWEENASFRSKLGGNPIKILTLQEVLSELYKTTGTSVASSEVGRLLQVIKAAGWKP